MTRSFLLGCCGVLIGCATGTREASDARAEESGTPRPEFPDLARFVNPFIGTLGSGNAIVGATMPHGMVKLSPDSYRPDNSVDAYEYSAPRIEGFSHTHLEGPGGSANGYSQVLVMPQTGALRVKAEEYASRFSHETEVAEPGYYAVTLEPVSEGEPVRVELTATQACGVHRYSFPPGVRARVLFDLGHTRGIPLAAEVQVPAPDSGPRPPAPGFRTPDRVGYGHRHGHGHGHGHGPGHGHGFDGPRDG